jgi:hypothetical protein
MEADMDRLVAAVVISALLAGILAGCQQPAAIVEQPRIGADQDTGLGTENSELPATLADLAQRDVEQFLKRREEASRAFPSAEEPPHIVWHTPSREPTREIAYLESEATELNAEVPDPPPLHRDSPPVLVMDEPAGASDATERRRATEELLVELSRELYRDASEADMPLRELLLIAATSMVDPDRALSPEAIPGLTERERELLAALQQFFLDLGRKLDGTRDVEETIAAAVDLLRGALAGAGPRFRLGTVALCTRVGGYGDFDEFSKYSFLAHTEQQTVLYVEVLGFTSELNDKGQWVTELSQQLAIYSDRDGIPVWREDWQRAVDATRNRRTDFFLVQMMNLPKELSVGRYHLKVRVRDERSGAEAERSVTVEMVADPRLAVGQR